MKTSLLIILFFLILPLDGWSQLTGIWQDDTGATYRIRQVDNEIFWSFDARPRVINVFHGIISGDIITGKWADVPDGRQMGSGTLALRVENQNRMVKIGSVGNYRASVWTRSGNNTTGGQNDPPIDPPDPPTGTNTPNALKIPGAVDLAVSNSDIWVSHGEWGIYKIPLTTKQAVSFDSNVAALHIAIDQNNLPWIVSTDRIVYYHNGSSWIKTNSGQCKTISIDRNNVAWAIDVGWWIKYFDKNDQKWVATEKIDGRALEVIDQNNMMHTNYYGVVSRKNNGSWSPLSDKLSIDDMGMTINGIAWAVALNSGDVYKFENGKWVIHPEYGKAKKIAVSPAGEAYTIKKE